jgi:hypothetical protein
MEKRGPDSDGETLAGFAEYVGQHTDGFKPIPRSRKRRVITQNPVKRFSLGRFCPDRFGRDVHPG